MASGDSTNVYDSGVLVSALPGRPLAWFEDDRLLVELDGFDVGRHRSRGPRRVRQRRRPHKLVFDTY